MRKLAFDIGAHSGSATEVFASHFERVIACEPAIESYNLLQGVTVRFPGVTTLNCALSDHVGTMDLAVQYGPMYSGQLTNGHPIWGKVDSWRTVPCRTIDDLTSEFGDPDMIKIDTEGSDLLVVSGGLKTITRLKPSIFIEVHDQNQGDKITALILDIYGEVERRRPAEQWMHDNNYWLLTRDISGSPIDLAF